MKYKNSPHGRVEDCVHELQGWHARKPWHSCGPGPVVQQGEAIQGTHTSHRLSLTLTQHTQPAVKSGYLKQGFHNPLLIYVLYTTPFSYFSSWVGHPLYNILSVLVLQCRLPLCEQGGVWVPFVPSLAQIWTPYPAAYPSVHLPRRDLNPKPRSLSISCLWLKLTVICLLSMVLVQSPLYCAQSWWRQYHTTANLLCTLCIYGKVSFVI